MIVKHVKIVHSKYPLSSFSQMIDSRRGMSFSSSFQTDMKIEPFREGPFPFPFRCPFYYWGQQVYDLPALTESLLPSPCNMDWKWITKSRMMNGWMEKSSSSWRTHFWTIHLHTKNGRRRMHKLIKRWVKLRISAKNKQIYSITIWYTQWFEAQIWEGKGMINESRKEMFGNEKWRKINFHFQTYFFHFPSAPDHYHHLKLFHKYISVQFKHV